MKLLTESGRTKMNMSDDDYASKAFLYLPAAVVHGSTLLSRPRRLVGVSLQSCVKLESLPTRNPHEYNPRVFGQSMWTTVRRRRRKPSSKLSNGSS